MSHHARRFVPPDSLVSCAKQDEKNPPNTYGRIVFSLGFIYRIVLVWKGIFGAHKVSLHISIFTFTFRVTLYYMLLVLFVYFVICQCQPVLRQLQGCWTIGESARVGKKKKKEMAFTIGAHIPYTWQCQTWQSVSCGDAGQRNRRNGNLITCIQSPEFHLKLLTAVHFAVSRRALHLIIIKFSYQIIIMDVLFAKLNLCVFILKDLLDFYKATRLFSLAHLLPLIYFPSLLSLAVL